MTVIGIIIVMNDKDSHNISNIYQNILNEAGFFGGVLQGMEKAHAGKNPWNTDKKEYKAQTLGNKNPPKTNQIIILSGNPKIRAVVLSKINKEGQYMIKLIGKTVNDPSPYAFYIWDEKPEGEILPQNIAPKQLNRMTNANKSDQLIVGYNTAYPAWVDYKTDLKNF
jgi:hypothetical protein